MASGSGARPDGNDVTASSLRVWAEYLKAVATRRDLEKRKHNAHLKSERVMELLDQVLKLTKEKGDLSRKVAFFKALRKFKPAMEAEKEFDENVDFGGLDESCINELQKQAAEIASSVDVRHVQHAEAGDISSLIEELTTIGKLLESSCGFQLAKLSTEAVCLEVASMKEESSISATLKHAEEAVLQLKCIQLLQRKGYIPVKDAAADPECGGISSGCSTLDAASGSRCADSVDSL